MIRNERTESDFFLSCGCFHPALSRRLSPERGEPLWNGDKASPASHAHHCVCVFECVCVCLIVCVCVCFCPRPAEISGSQEPKHKIWATLNTQQRSSQIVQRKKHIFSEKSEMIKKKKKKINRQGHILYGRNRNTGLVIMTQYLISMI